MPYDRARHGPRRVVGPGFHEQVYALVQQVPEGMVSTYGDIAGQLGLRSVARHVGFALAALPPERKDVPWHRIVAAGGRLSARGEEGWSRRQGRRLRAEGTRVDARGRVKEFRERHFRFE